MMTGFGVSIWFIALVLFVLLLLGIPVVLIILFSRGTFGSGSNQSSDFSGAKEILDQRYARGEISRDEYERMKQDISR